MARTKESSPEPADSKDAAPRLSVQLTADGTAIDWARIRPSTREQMQKVGIGSPGASAVPASPAFQFPAGWCVMVLDAVAQLEIAAAMKLYGCTLDQAKVLLFTDPEKASLVPSLQKVLDKYAGTMFLKFGDEMLLVASLGAIAIPKVMQLREVLDAAPQAQADIRPFVKREDAPTV